MNLAELRKERHHIAAKISSRKKAGKDITDLLKQEADIVAQIKAINPGKEKSKPAPTSTPAKKYPIQVVQIPESSAIPKKPVTKIKQQPAQPAKSWKKSELEKCERTLNRLIEDNDWHDGYQFRSSEWMSIKDISTRVLSDSVELTYTIQYKTKNRRVEKVVTKYFNPDTVQGINEYIEQVELWVMLNSGDMDDKTIIFGARFNKVQFDAKGMAGQGWIIKK